MEVEEKEFFHKQALDSKRKNKLLKVAIGRLQADNERKKLEAGLEETPAALENGKAPLEKDTDTFLTGAKIDEKDPTDNVDSLENAQALVEQNLMSNQNLRSRRGLNQSV